MDLNRRDTEEFERVKEAAGEADILLSTAALVYLDLETIEAVVTAFAEGGGSDEDNGGSGGEGYVLVNFLNPFAPERADAAKRILPDRPDFAGSGAARRRGMSELERGDRCRAVPPRARLEGRVPAFRDVQTRPLLVGWICTSYNELFEDTCGVQCITFL